MGSKCEPIEIGENDMELDGVVVANVGQSPHDRSRVIVKVRKMQRIQAKVNAMHDQMERMFDRLERYGYIGIFNGNDFRLVKVENYDKSQFQ